ncbi:hypothetical protein [Halomonas sp. A3H3]|uniref:hypothetical protein n=1 Tax=Halomonas sp. A3H3 TaxID=1346287 RepID=UPI001EE2561C|nr:hypothetical protein [Halomonas sp. A3H3]
MELIDHNASLRQYRLDSTAVGFPHIHAATISERLDSQAPAEISHLTQVNKGYGVCGDYELSSAESGRFYYNHATKRLVLGTDAPLYHDNCEGVSD